jgi:hypothetical protein
VGHFVPKSSDDGDDDTGVGPYGSIGDVFFKVIDGQKYVLVMKLSRNDFCMGSSKWTDGQPFNSDKMLDDTMPRTREYDAKSIAFHKMEDVTELRFQTARGGDVAVTFAKGATPEKLMTTNEVDFEEYPDWYKWREAFGSDRNRAPVFVRAGQVVTKPTPKCRNSNFRVSGCGKTCMFCMVAGDGGDHCQRYKTSGAHNDITSGIGGDRRYCGSGWSHACSTSGRWMRGYNSVRIYAKVPGNMMGAEYPRDKLPDCKPAKCSKPAAAKGLYIKGCDNKDVASPNSSPVVVTNPPENSRTYSSVWSNNRIGTGHARSMLDSSQAWSSQRNVRGSWMQMDLGKVTDVAGVVTQARRGNGQWVNKYKVFYSEDGAASHLNPPQSRRKYSSVWGGDRHNNGHRWGELDSRQGWSSQHNRRGQWMQMDLGTPTKVAGIVTQGRTCNCQWVNHYRVKVSDDERSWTDVPGRYYGGRTHNRKKEQRFQKEVKARYVRIVVESWGGHMSMRAGVITGGSLKEVPGVYTAGRSSNNRIEAKFPEVIMARFVRIVVQTWGGHLSMRAGLITGGGGCRIRCDTGYMDKDEGAAGDKTWMKVVDNRCSGNWEEDKKAITTGKELKDCKKACADSYSCHGFTYSEAIEKGAAGPLFKYDHTHRTYDEQVKKCEEYGMTIASIRDAAENTAAFALIRTVTYIGAESDGAGNWKWRDGTPWSSSFARTDGIRGTRETKICLNRGDKKWHDWNQGQSRWPVLCRRKDAREARCALCTGSDKAVTVDPAWDFYKIDNRGMRECKPKGKHGGEFTPALPQCVPLVCSPGAVPNSIGHEAAGSLKGSYGESEVVVCKAGHTGGGKWTCDDSKKFTGKPCSENVCEPPGGTKDKAVALKQWEKKGCTPENPLGTTVSKLGKMTPAKGFKTCDVVCGPQQNFHCSDGTNCFTFHRGCTDCKTDNFNKAEYMPWDDEKAGEFCRSWTANKAFKSVALLEQAKRFGEGACPGPVTYTEFSRAKCRQMQGKVYNPPEHKRRYSSVWSNNRIGTGHARSMLDSPQAWSSRYNWRNQWMQMDLDTTMQVAGVVLQARRGNGQWVNNYHVLTSKDGSSFTQVPGVYYGGRSGDTRVEAKFPKPVAARYVRIQVQSWGGHLSMRAGIIRDPEQPLFNDGASIGTMTLADCDKQCSSGRVDKKSRPCLAFQWGDGGLVLDEAQKRACYLAWDCSVRGDWSGGSAHVSSLLMPKDPDPDSAVINNIPESQRSYSTVWSGNAIGTGHARSMLDSPQAWSAQHNRKNEWMQFDLGSTTNVYGIATQARRGNGQWVNNYGVKISDDMAEWEDVPGTYNAGRSSDNKVEVKFAKSVAGRFVRIVVNTWGGHLSMRAAPITDPPSFSSVQVVNPPESARSYSSVWSRNRIGTGHARSMLDSPQAWSAQHNRRNEWMQIDLGSKRRVYGVVSQGRTGNSQWVNNYKVKISDDGSDYADVPGNFMAGRTHNTYKETKFDSAVSARYVKIYVQSWGRHISARFGLLASPGKKGSVLSVVNVPESQRKYSSVWGGDRMSNGHRWSMLDSRQAWSSQHNRRGQWMQMDLGSTKSVRGIITQTRSGNSQWVKRFEVHTSTDCSSFTKVTSGSSAGLYQAAQNSDGTHRKVEARFESVVSARCVRLVVHDWGRHMSMRAAVLVGPGGIGNAEDGVAEGQFGLVVTGTNECENDPCDVNAVCKDTEGSYTCTCRDGFTGTGFGRTPVSCTPAKCDVPDAAVGLLITGCADMTTGQKKGKKGSVVKALQGEPKKEPKIVYFSTSMGHREPPQITQYLEQKWKTRITDGIKDHGSYCLKEPDHLNDHRNQGLCRGGSNRNFGQRFEVNFYEPTGAKWDFWFFLDAGWGFQTYLDDVLAKEETSDIWHGGNDRNLHAIRDLEVGNHKLVVYGGEGCCDGNAGSWKFKRGSSGWTTLSVANLKKISDQASSTALSILLQSDADREDCKMVCANGYKKTGGVEGPKTCMPKDGSTAEFTEIPTCTPATCDAPPALKGRSDPTVCKGKIVGQTCDLTCEKGFSAPTGEGAQTCTGVAGKDEAEFPADKLPKCTAASCPMPAVDDANIKDCEGLKAGDNGCSITCKPGFQADNYKDFEMINVPENKRSYSTVWSGNSLGTGHARSMIDSPQAWSAQHNSKGQWMQMDLGDTFTNVAGIATQARRGNSQYVTKYTVQVSTDANSYTNVPGEYTAGRSGETKVESKFPSPVVARYVRIVASSWGGHLSMRAAVLTAGKVFACVGTGKGKAELVPSLPKCRASTCTPTAVPNSIGHTKAGSISGTTHTVVNVACVKGYSGGGVWVCGVDGKFKGQACLENECDSWADKTKDWWLKQGCVVQNSGGTTVSSLKKVSPAPGWSSCTISCPVPKKKKTTAAMLQSSNLMQTRVGATYANFGPVPGFYESGNRKYVAIRSDAHASQQANEDLIRAAACLTALTSCEYTSGTYGLRLPGSQQNPAYQNNDQAHTCLNGLTGSTNFYQRTTNGYTYIFATSDSAMSSLNTAITAGCISTLVNPSELKRTYSSVYGDNEITNPYRQSMIDSTTAWIPAAPRTGQYLEIDLGDIHNNVVGVMTQCGGGASHGCVTAFTVKASVDRTTYTDVPGGPYQRASTLAADDKDSKTFPAAVTARYIRILPTVWTAPQTVITNLAMRAGVLTSGSNTHVASQEGQYVVHSSQVDECTTLKPCDGNAECEDTVGSYICTCNDGYTGNGLKGNCAGIACSAPAAQTGRSTDCDDLAPVTTTEKCRIDCDDGYKVSSGTAGDHVCTASGPTTVSFVDVPVCQPATCAAPPAQTGRVAVASCSSTTTGQSCSVTCADGYADEDGGGTEGAQKCTATSGSDTASFVTASLPDCQPVTCTEPLAQTGRTATGCGSRETGDVGCNIVCDAGYTARSGTVEGAKTCTATGKGTSAFPDIPECEADDCTDSKVANSVAYSASGSLKGVTGETKTINCKTGYTTNGAGNTWKCNAPVGEGKGVWSGPACAENTCNIVPYTKTVQKKCAGSFAFTYPGTTVMTLEDCFAKCSSGATVYKDPWTGSDKAAAARVKLSQGVENLATINHGGQEWMPLIKIGTGNCHAWTGAFTGGTGMTTSGNGPVDGSGNSRNTALSSDCTGTLKPSDAEINAAIAELGTDVFMLVWDTKRVFLKETRPFKANTDANWRTCSTTTWDGTYKAQCSTSTGSHVHYGIDTYESPDASNSMIYSDNGCNGLYARPDGCGRSTETSPAYVYARVGTAYTAPSDDDDDTKGEPCVAIEWPDSGGTLASDQKRECTVHCANVDQR